MRKFLPEAWAFLKQVFSEFNEDDCFSMAASLAYYTVFSLAPMLLIVMVVMGLVVSPDEAQRALYGQFESLIGAEGATQIQTMLEHVRQDRAGNVVARVFGIAIL